jgi:chitin deacetylase
VHLTFDDGPGPSTPDLLDVLATRAVRATFFLLGRNVEAHLEIARRIAREGHVLGNHTWSHARPGALSARDFVAEIERTDELIEAIAPDRGLPPVRLPYGPAPLDPRLPVLASLGRSHVHWTADFEDWLPTTDAGTLARRMCDHVAAHPEAVLDLHDASRRGERRDATVAAVRMFLDDLGPSAFR